MKPTLVALDALSSSDNPNSIAKMVEDWKALEKLLELYASDQLIEETSNPKEAALRNHEEELDRITDRQHSLFLKVMTATSQSTEDILAKLELWKNHVSADGQNQWLSPSDKLVLSVLSDLEEFTQAETYEVSFTA